MKKIIEGNSLLLVITILVLDTKTKGNHLWIETQNIQPEKNGSLSGRLIHAIELPLQEFLSLEVLFLSLFFGGPRKSEDSKTQVSK